MKNQNSFRQLLSSSTVTFSCSISNENKLQAEQDTRSQQQNLSKVQYKCVTFSMHQYKMSRCYQDVVKSKTLLRYLNVATCNDKMTSKYFSLLITHCLWWESVESREIRLGQQPLAEFVQRYCRGGKTDVCDWSNFNLCMKF